MNREICPFLPSVAFLPLHPLASSLLKMKKRLRLVFAAALEPAAYCRRRFSATELAIALQMEDEMRFITSESPSSTCFFSFSEFCMSVARIG